jgi:hypothetical protein
VPLAGFPEDRFTGADRLAFLVLATKPTLAFDDGQQLRAGSFMEPDQAARRQVYAAHVQVARPKFQLCTFEQTRDHEIAAVLGDLPAFRGVEAEG